MGPCGGLAVRAADVPVPIPVAVGAPVNDESWTPPSWDEVVRTHSARVYRLA